MIIFNKSEQQAQDLSFILPSSSSTQHEVEILQSCKKKLKQRDYQKSNLNQTKVLSEINKNFLINLGFKLKNNEVQNE